MKNNKTNEIQKLLAKLSFIGNLANKGSNNEYIVNNNEKDELIKAMLLYQKINA